MLIKQCLICKKDFKIFPYRLRKKEGIYCSKTCKGIAKRGIIPWNKGKKVFQMTGFNHPHWGKKFSLEIRNKMSNARKGKSPWNKGTKGICRAWNKGIKMPQITGEKHPLFGKYHSLETIKKLIEHHKGQKAWNKGKHYKLSPEVCLQHKITALRIGIKPPVRRGKDNHMWKGGITPINKIIRNSNEYKQWRKAVFERDNYTCQKCSIKGIYLEADHIKAFAYYPELRFDINNGRTLCRPCHKLTPNFGRKNRPFSK